MGQVGSLISLGRILRGLRSLDGFLILCILERKTNLSGIKTCLIKYQIDSNISYNFSKTTKDFSNKNKFQC